MTQTYLAKFERISIRSETANLECANKKFFENAQYPTIETLNLPPYTRLKFEGLEKEKLVEFTQRYTHIKQLSLSRCRNLTDAGIREIRQALPGSIIHTHIDL